MPAIQKYNPFISIMKGIAIISVVLGHATVGSTTEMIVNQYHLSVFFFVAGYCFKDKYLLNFISYAWRRFKSLYVPFMEFGLLFILLHNFFYCIHIEDNPYSFEDVIHEIRNITVGMTSEDPLMGAMWFCPALFSVSLISFFCLKIGYFFAYRVNKRYSLLFIFLAFVFVICCGRLLITMHVKSPRNMWEYIQITGLFFYGYLVKRLINERKCFLIKKYAKYILSLCVLIISILLIVGYRAYLQPQTINGENLFFVYIIAGLSSLVIVEMSFIITKSKLAGILSYIGNHSFCIMALHFLCFKTVTYIYCIYRSEDLKLLQSFPTIHPTPTVMVVVYTIIGVLLPLALSSFYFMSKRYAKNFILNGRDSNS